MSKQVGLWIDHRRAVVVTVLNGVELTEVVASGSERSAGHEGNHMTPSDDSQDRRFHQHLDGFYDGLIASIHDAETILIMGPGEAKGELKKRIDKKGHLKGTITVETADKMTDGEVAARVRASLLTPASGKAPGG